MDGTTQRGPHRNATAHLDGAWRLVVATVGSTETIAPVGYALVISLPVVAP